MIYYTILYYTILYYTTLYYTILYYTILCYATLHYTMLPYALPIPSGARSYATALRDGGGAASPAAGDAHIAMLV